MRNVAGPGSILFLLLGCTPDFVAPESPRAEIALAQAPWNASASADVGTVTAVVERGPTLTLFGSKGVVTLGEGATPAVDASVTDWRAAAAVPSTDGASTWLVGVDAGGRLRRIADGGAVDVSATYGVASGGVEEALSGGGLVALRLDDGFAIADGTKVTRYHDAAPRSLAVSPVRAEVALADDEGVRVFAGGREVSLPLAGATQVAYDGSGHLLAATAHVVYAIEAGTASAIYDAGTRTVRQLVGAGTSVWITIDLEVARINGATLAWATGPRLTPEARLLGAPSGDLWLSAPGRLERWTASPTGGGGGERDAGPRAPNDDQAEWTATVKPILDRVCSRCHAPDPGRGGSSLSGIDLSTYDAWVARRDTVYTRVVTNAGTAAAMPPDAPLSGAEESALAAWAKP